MFNHITFTKEQPIYLQIKNHIKQLISKGMLQEGEKLPSTRELAFILKTGRNAVIEAYHALEDEGFVLTTTGKGTFVACKAASTVEACHIQWSRKISEQAQLAEELDMMKHGVTYEKGMIAFTSIAPDEALFDLELLKRAFLDKISAEGPKILNYGYAKGYRPLMEYLLKYMENKGLNIEGKDILITNGFTEGFDLLLSALCSKGQRVLCENPTHNTAIKIMKLHGLEPVGIPLESDGINLQQLSDALTKGDIRLSYLIPSYQNPTGIVMSPEKRTEALRLFGKHQVPVIEDGFNEELRYLGAHIAPLIACNGKGNNVIYTGSFSKVLFPGLRIGWIIADQELIYSLESLKRSRNIHTSTLDQALLHQFLLEGSFERTIKKARKAYREKYEIAVKCAGEHIPCTHISGEGGLHIFIELDRRLNARSILEQCRSKAVVFTPGDIFFTDHRGANTLRIGFSRVPLEDIPRGIKIIGEVVKETLNKL